MILTIAYPAGLMNSVWKPVFRQYFSEQGITLHCSKPSDREILQKGKKNLPEEFCLPAKLFAGQVAQLVEETPYPVFVPMVTGSRRLDSFLCHIQIRMADILTATDIIPKDRLLAPHFTFDEQLNLSNDGFQAMSRQLDLPSPDNHLRRTAVYRKNGEPDRPLILVIGAPYVLEDPFLIGNLFPYLDQLGFSAIVVDGRTNYPGDVSSLASLSHFSLSAALLASAAQAMEKLQPDGLIYLKPFLCGPNCSLEDNFAILLKERKHKQLPGLTLVLDENRSEGGLLTRLEAFTEIVLAKRDGRKREVS